MYFISKETWKNSVLRTATFDNITNNKKELRLKMHNIQVEIGVENMSDLVRKKFIIFVTPKTPLKNRFGIIKHGLMTVFTLWKKLIQK